MYYYTYVRRLKVEEMKNLWICLMNDRYTAMDVSRQNFEFILKIIYSRNIIIRYLEKSLYSRAAKHRIEPE